MAEKKLAELFQASNGSPVEWRGELVHMMHELTGLTAGDLLEIEFSNPSPARPQALRVKARGGALEVHGQRLDDVVLWSDSSPRLVLATAHPKSSAKPMTVRLWNAWRDSAGAMHAWIGNAGLLVEDRLDDAVVLRCSDGFDAPTFDDLTATIRIVRTTS